MKIRPAPLVALIIALALVLGACNPVATPTASQPTAAATQAPAEPTQPQASDPTQAAVEPTAVEPTAPLQVIKEEISIADALPAVTLDPHGEGFSQADTQIINAIHSTLVGWKDGMEGTELEGRLATEWSLSDDGLVWTFELRDGVTWQKGYGPFTADDVLFSFERLMDPDRSRSANLVTGVIESVMAVDDLTVEIRLASPNADFLPAVIQQFRTGTIISRAALDDIGDADYRLNPIGTGPYQLTERLLGDRTVIERNPDYWGAQPDVPRFVFVEISEESVRADALEAGQIDIASIRSPANIGRLIENANLEVKITYDRPAIWVLAISERAVPDVRVREAIARAIDKHELAETVLQYRSNPNVVAYHGPGLAGFPTDATEELYTYDPDRSRELLAEAGVEPGSLTLYYPTRADFLELSQAVAGYLEAVGINTTLEVQEQALFRETIGSGGEGFDLTNFFPSRATATEMLAYYGAPISSNQYDLGPPERVIELYEAQRSEVDPAARAALIQEMLDIVHADLPWVVLGYAASSATVHQPYIDGPFINYVSELNVPAEYITIDQAAYGESR